MTAVQRFRTGVFAALLCVAVHGASYADLESMGIACPVRDTCRGGGGGSPFYERNCECDSACHTYRDCCIDVRKRTAAPAADVTCLHYGQDTHSGVYVVSKCSKDWTGPREVKRSCEGPTDFSDPLSAAPVTSADGTVSYKNLHCAQCNGADMNSLKVFTFRLSCEGLSGLSEEQIMEQIFFNEEENAWGVERSAAGGRPEFKSCVILFELPQYLEKNVRFCRSNIVSECARDWTRPQVRRSCEQYMAVVYSRTKAYRNPHCALCNHLTPSQLSCYPDAMGRKKPLPFSALIDINQKSSRTPSCPADELYDPYFKRCRRLSCAVPGYVVSDGKCVPGR